MPDYIPPGDPEFDIWSANLTTKVVANPTNYGETALTVANLSARKTDWDSKFPAHTTAQQAAEAARQAKQTSRNLYETEIRVIVGRMQESTAVDDTERADLGITIRDTTPTPVGPPTSKPVLQVDTRERQRHIIGFADEGAPTSKAKPAGVSGVELWVKIGGPPPVDVSQCVYLATDTKTPYTADYDGADLGQVAHYMARWVSTRNEPGPWSETVSQTIGA